MDVQVHDADGADAFRQEVLEVWATAFGPVDDADDWRRSTWDRHRAREDYRLVTARVDDGRLAGFGWGYTGRRGQYWPDLVVDRACACDRRAADRPAQPTG